MNIVPSEIMVMLLSLALLFFVLFNYSRLRHFPGFPFQLMALGFFLAAKIFTILEGLFWYDILNSLEHLCYLAFGLFLLLWTWRIIKQEPKSS